MSDYLWDKTGRDAEVEALEASLSGLAYDGDPPVLPAPRRAPLAPGARLPEMVPGQVRLPWGGARVAPIAVAGVLLVAGLGLAYSALERQRAEVRKGWNLVPVLVAAVDLEPGAVLTPELVAQRSVPEQLVSGSTVKPDSASYVIGQRVVAPVAVGDPLLWSQFESAKVSERLATRIPKRTRALSVPVRATAAVGGWVRPNDAVDIIGSFKDPATNEPVAVTLMQNVTVLATGRISATTNENLLPEADRAYGDVSLLVLPEEAEMLALAQELGNLTFTLRSPDDVDVLEERGRATIHTLLSGERTRVLQQKRFNTIQVIRGTTPPGAPR